MEGVGTALMEKIEKVSTTESATRAIRKSILSGEYQVGDKLSTESQLCQALNVSRTVVREALRVLATEGYVRMIPGRGAFVARVTEAEDYWSALSASSFKDVMDVRMPVEELAVRMAVRRSAPELVGQLEANYDALVHANEALDKQEMIRLDEQFHMLIFKATENALLVNFGRQIIEAFNRFRYASFYDDKNYSNALGPHRRIIEAFRRQNEEEAAEAMRYHMTRAIEDISAHIGAEK